MKKIHLDKNEKKYPYVFLPSIIIRHINQGYDEKEILKFLNVEKPVFSQNIKSENFSHYSLNKTKNINYVLNLKNDSIDENLENDTFYYGKHKLPKMPNLYNVKEKIYVDYETGFSNILKTLILIPGIAFCIFFIFVTIGPIFISNEERKSFSLLKLIIIASPTIYLLIITFVLTKGWNNIFEKKTKKVRELLDEETRNQLLNKYKSKINLIIKKNELDYQNNLINYNQIIENNYQNAEIGILNNNISQNHTSLIDNKNSKKGRNEVAFLNHLYDLFGRNILIDYSPNIGKNPFQPDYILHDKEMNFYIDIEIDEPYSILNGETIHHNRTKDEERNKFFNEINWGVIRFTERQIVETPKLCCILIEDVLKAIKKRGKFVEHNIIEESFWTHEEALIMKLNNYRDSYN